MFADTSLWTLAVLGGAVGGSLNALLTRDLRLLPSSRAGYGLIRLGGLANVALGGAIAALVFPALQAPCGAVAGASWSSAAGGALAGLMAARLAAGELDKRLLRDAVCKASAAPAAHPTTVARIAAARPDVVQTLADDLMPRAVVGRDRYARCDEAARGRGEVRAFFR
jgi:Alpha/beta hydrolase domain containing 18